MLTLVSSHNLLTPEITGGLIDKSITGAYAELFCWLVDWANDSHLLVREIANSLNGVLNKNQAFVIQSSRVSNKNNDKVCVFFVEKKLK